MSKIQKQSQDHFKPLRIDLDSPTEDKDFLEIIKSNRTSLHKKIVEAITHCIKNRLPKIAHAEGYFKETLVLIVSIKSEDFEFHLDTSLQILEDAEEYESCAKIIELKESLKTFKPKMPRKKKHPDTLHSVIKSL
jgi:hypothetical protein